MYSKGVDRILDDIVNVDKLLASYWLLTATCHSFICQRAKTGHVRPPCEPLTHVG